MISPLDLRRRQFSRRLLGYREEEVEDFLNRCADEYESLFDENEKLRSLINRTALKVEACRTWEYNLDQAGFAVTHRANESQREAAVEAQNLLSDTVSWIKHTWERHREILERTRLYQSELKSLMTEQYRGLSASNSEARTAFTPAQTIMTAGDLEAEIKEIRFSWQKILSEIDAALAELGVESAPGAPEPEALPRLAPDREEIDVDESISNFDDTVDDGVYAPWEPLAKKLAAAEDETAEAPAIRTRPALTREQVWSARRSARANRRARPTGTLVLFIVMLITVMCALGTYGWDYLKNKPLFHPVETPSQTSVKTPAKTVQEQPVTSSADASKMLEAAGSGQLQNVKKLLQEGISPNQADPKGITPLMVAAYSGYDAVVTELLKAGADPDAYTKENKVTALMYASYAGQLETDVNARSSGGWSALMCASYSGHPATARLLLEAGADAKYQTREGWNAPTLAYLNEHGQTVKVFQETAAVTVEQGTGIDPDRRCQIETVFEPKTK
jgi:DivIVA domain-containing protein